MKNFVYILTISLFSAVFMAGCANFAHKSPSASSAVDIDEQVLSQIEQMRGSADYILQPGDLVEIKVFMEDDMDRTLRISGQGTVTFPLVGNVKIAGNSVASAENVISRALKTYLKNPQISMLIKEYGNKTVYVLGQVTKPSAIQIPPERSLTVLEAISSVGGFTDVAAQSKVRVLREKDGKHQSIDIDISQITKVGNKSLDIALQPGDVVFVPQSIF